MFSVTTLPTAPVAGTSGSTTLTVTFAPTSSGAKTAALHIASNDVGGLLGTLSALSDVTMVAGQTYIIKVASNDPTGSETGVLDFSFQFEPGLPDPCPADITPAGGDGIVGPADLASLLAAWGACAACPADFTADGAVGPADLAQLLANWGSCP